MSKLNDQLPKSFIHNGKKLDINELMQLPLRKLQGMVTPTYIPENELKLYIFILQQESERYYQFENRNLHHIEGVLKRALFNVQKEDE